MLSTLNLYRAMYHLISQNQKKNLKKKKKELLTFFKNILLTSIHAHGFYVSKHFNVIVLML